MTTGNGSQNGFPTNARSAVFLYIGHGLSPIRLPPRSKEPGYSGWQSLRLTLETLDSHFPPNESHNVGILNGAPSGDHLDVDLDCPEALLVAPMLLPKTGWVFGRKSAPRSHWIYRADRSLSAAQQKYTDLNGTVLIELRGTGGLTVYPPSTHKDTGEDITWDQFTKPADIKLCVLEQVVRDVATISLLARHWVIKGSRQDAFLALAGGLLRTGFEQGRVRGLIEALVAVTRDDEPAKRVQVVEVTAEKLEQGTKATGWPTLEEHLGKDGRAVVQRARDWLRIRTDSPRPVFKSKKKLQTAEPYQPFPVAVLPAPIREFVQQGSLALGCDPAYLALPVLAVVASAIGNTRTIALKRDWHEPSIVWSVIVGDSGTLKSPAYLKAISYLLRVQKRMLKDYRDALAQYQEDLADYKEAKRAAKEKAKEKKIDPGKPPQEPVYQRVILSDITIQKVAEVLEDNPRGVLVARDELAGWFGSFRQFKGGSEGSDLPNWLEMYRAGNIIVDRKTGDRKHYFVERAAVSITGGIQPRVLARVLTTEFLDAGGGARIIMAMPPKHPKKWTEIEIDPEVEEAYHNTLVKLLTLDFAMKDNDQVPHVLQLSADAKSAWIEFYNSWGGEQALVEGDLAAAFSKLEAYAARFALIHSVVNRVSRGENDLVPVDKESIEAGVALCRWFANEVRRIYAIIAETEEEQDIRRLVEFIWSRGGSITGRNLQKSNSRKYPKAELAEAKLELLVQAELGEWVEQPSTARGGQPTRCFRLHPTSDITDTTPDEREEECNLAQAASDTTMDAAVRNPIISDVSEGSVGSVGCRNHESGAMSGSEPAEKSHAISLLQKEVLSGDSPSDLQPAGSSLAYSLVVDSAGLDTIATALNNSGPVGLDIETTGLDPRIDRARLLTLSTDQGVFIVDLYEIDPTPLFGLLSSKILVGHNLQFDLGFLTRLGFVPGRVSCTFLSSQLLHAGQHIGHKLADCVKRELGRNIDKTEQKSNWSADLSHEQLAYAAEDAAVLVLLYNAQQVKLKQAGLARTESIESGCLPAIAWLASSGVGFDKPAWEALAAEARSEAEKLRAELDAAAPSDPERMFPDMNWDSPEQVQRVFALLGCKIEDTNDNTLAALDHPLAGLLRQYRGAQKRATTYGKDWLKHFGLDGRIHGNWAQIGAASGRMACRSPNLQNLPRDSRYRKCFIAPPGRVLIKADYSQIELRIAATISGDIAMLNAYKEGADLHNLTAQQVLHIQNVTKDQRQLAKALNFGLLYGMGAKRFRIYARTQFAVRMSEEDGKGYRKAFFRAYPGLAKWHRSIPDQPIEVRTLTGRRRVNVVRFTDKLNAPVQGAGADGLKLALALLWERRHEVPGAFPVLAVHDEIVVEADAEQDGAVELWLKKAMIDAMAPMINPVPVEVEVKICRTWGGD